MATPTSLKLTTYERRLLGQVQTQHAKEANDLTKKMGPDHQFLLLE